MSSVYPQTAVAVCGVKNSGKTTLIERLVRIFAQQGLRVAVIKHDGHEFCCDVPGTDSDRYMCSGAYGSVVFSEDHLCLQRKNLPVEPLRLFALFPEADLIFVEGMKASTLPKIECIRCGISEKPVSNPVGRFLIVSDWPVERFAERAVPFSDLETIAKSILAEIKKYGR